MSRTVMFPQKSKLQVAICLECLLHAERLAYVKAAINHVTGYEAETELLRSIYVLCHTRLLSLIRPILYSPRAAYYNPKIRFGKFDVSPDLAAVRGWRRDHPHLLRLPGQEK